MAQKEKTKIQILKGLLVLDGTEYPKSSTIEVGPSVLEWLEGKKSHTLDFSVVGGDKPNSANVPTDNKPSDQGPDSQGAGFDEDQGPDSQGAGFDEDQDGNQDQDQDQVQSGNSDQGPQTRLGLKSVDAALEARLADAGLDSLEKLQGVSVGKLTTIKGVGKLRAEAIKAEVGAL